MRVFKYRGGDWPIIKRELKSLSKNQIFSASIENLNDLFEAQVIFEGKSFELGKILRWIPGFKYTENVQKAESEFLSVVSNFVKESKKFGVYSLSKSVTDELLWAHYANSHSGFCLEYDLDLLLDYTLKNEQVIKVNYSQTIPRISVNDFIPLNKHKDVILKKLVGTKSKRWAYEDEIRLVTGKTGPYEYDFRALKAIYFGHRSTPRLKKLIMRLMRGRNIRYFQIDPVNSTYQLKPIPQIDPYAEYPPYRARIAPIDNGVPYIDDELRPYEAIVRKALEIARREPYCEKVYDVFISRDKGTPENPVFFVNYLRSDGYPRNFYYSLKDIISAPDFTT